MKPLRYLLILCGLTLCTSQLHAYETLYTTIDSIEYSFLDSEDGGTASVCGFVEGLTNAVIPETIQVEGYGTKRVTDFASYAFRNCTTLKSVVIPNTVGTLGTYSFYGCSSLTSINIPATVTRIGSYAFWGCSSLASIHLPQYIDKIEDCTFYGCSSLTSLTLPKYMTKIGNYAFQRCSSLTSLILPDKLIQIDSNAFNGCIGLTSISIPKSVTSMGNGVFSECANLSSVIIQNGFTVIPDYTFSKCTSLVSLDIPNSVTTIGREAFYGCTSLTSIDIPNTVTSIGGRAFINCTSLTSISFPEGITSISNIIDGCTSLAHLTIPGSVKTINELSGLTNLSTVIIRNGTQTIGDYAFSRCTNLTSITIPESVTSIGNYAFGSTGLTSISIPESVTSLGRGAFSECVNLSSVNIPDGIIEIKDYTFSNCSSLVSLDIPQSVTTIGREAFYGCTSLTSIDIPNTVTSIGGSAFYGCTSLTSIHIPNTVTSIGGSAFKSCTSLTSISFPEGITSISNIIIDCTSLTHLTIPGSVKTIDELRGLTNLSTVIIRNGTQTIGDNAFRGCTNLTSITIPESVTSIGNYAFGSTGLTSISIPESVTSLGSGAFSECVNLSSVNIPDGIIEIKDYAFSNCSSLVSLDIPQSVTTIGREAFFGCTSLTSIHIPNTVTSIGGGAFKSCTSLTTVNIPDGIIEIPYELFRYCSSLTSVTIPDGVTTVGDYAFDLCTSLVSVNIPEGVTSIGAYSFATTALTSIIIPASLTEIKNHAFLYTYFTSVYISDGITNINWEIFDGTSLVSLSIPCGINAVESRYLFKNDATAHGMITIRGNSVFVKPIDGNYNIVYNVDAGMYDKYSRSSVWNKYLKQVISADMLNLTTVECTADSLQSNLFSQLGDNALYVANLKVKGSINGYDIMTLRNKTVHLLYLDLSEADVVANDGGYEYYPGCRMTEDNKFGDRSFYGTNLRRVVMPNTLKTIGKYSFADCGFLETVVLNQGLETIDENAFNNCRFLETADFKEGLETINMNAFRNCTRYVVKNLPKSLVTIGNEAFRYDKIASYLEIPDNVVTIGAGAFRDCSGVDTIIVGKSVIELNDHAFGGSPASYVSLDKARGLTRLGQYAFGTNRNLKTITFGRNDKLTVVGNWAFEYCSSLEEILLPFSVESIGAGAFRDCSSLKYIKIPSMTRTIGEGAFSGCDYIENIYTYTVEPTEINQNTFTCFLQATLNVPKTSALLYKYDTQWSQFVRVHEFEEPYDAFYLKGDLELTEDGGRLEGEPDADMYETSGFIVQGDDIQELNDVVLVHNGTDGATIIGASGDVTGSQVNLSAKSMKVNISVDGNRWYFFCFPFEVEQDSIECTTEHVFYEYDSQARANGNTGWVKVPDDFGFLSKDVGYIFQTNRSGILTIHVGSDYLTFTANNEKENLQTASSNNPADAHWNFIGNPYISYYDVQDLAQEYDAPIAIWNGRSYDVYKPGDDDYQLKPFEAFFVQKETGASYVEFLPENRMTYNRAAEVSSLRAARRAQIGTPIDLDRQLVNIVLMGQDSITDRTRIVYNVNASMDYEIGVDAAKFQADGVPQLYTLNGKTKYAINERPMGTDEIKLGYTAPKAGTYTLSVPRHDAEVEIYDNVAKSKVDFTFGDYSFQTQAGTFNDRFVVYKTSGGVTKVEDGFRLDGMTVRTVDGGIVIEGNLTGKVQVYSDSGMLLAEPARAGKVELGDGVYIIKIGDKSVKIGTN